jgi:hypothetical protein
MARLDAPRWHETTGADLLDAMQRVHACLKMDAPRVVVTVCMDKVREASTTDDIQSVKNTWDIVYLHLSTDEQDELDDVLGAVEAELSAATSG